LRQNVVLLIGTEEKNAEQKNELADIRKRLDALARLSRQMRDMIDGELGKSRGKSRANKMLKKNMVHRFCNLTKEIATCPLT
jgi:hypothetical protein